MKKGVVFILATVVCMFVFWYGGVDFSERGFLQAYLLFCSLCLSTLVASMLD